MANHYKPLPACLTIANSTIEGLGLFATLDIEKGTCLGISHIQVNGKLIRTPLGGFYNHSNTPNVRRVTTDDGISRLYAITNIVAGDEIVATYRLYDPTC